MFLCFGLSVLCLFSVWCLSVSCFWFSVRSSLLVNRSQLSFARVNCIPKVGGLRSPEASKFARIIAYGEIMFIHTMWESSSLLILSSCSVLHVKSHLSHQHILNQLETAVLDSTHSTYKHDFPVSYYPRELACFGAAKTPHLRNTASLLLKLLVSDLWTLLWTIMVIEILGPSIMLKLLVTDLWTSLWNILFIHTMWECSSLLILSSCSVLHVKSHLSHQHILNQLEIAVLDSTHSMCQLEIQDEVQL